MSFDLERFVAAQEGVYPQALGELRRGRKQSHWMWFVFPQLAALGRSETARFYALASAEEARLYLAHPLLGPRLRECAAAILAHRGLGAEAIFGPVDTLKLKSSMTLFEAAAADPAPFAALLDAFFGGERDAATLALIDG
ncbi:MAG: hypothetical protein QOG13_2388 [Sphingomonadales bacterium]|nr:hypothetical protein [Sphingomonadales bacterium]